MRSWEGDSDKTGRFPIDIPEDWQGPAGERTPFVKRKRPVLFLHRIRGVPSGMDAQSGKHSTVSVAASAISQVSAVIIFSRRRTRLGDIDGPTTPVESPPWTSLSKGSSGWRGEPTALQNALAVDGGKAWGGKALQCPPAKSRMMLEIQDVAPMIPPKRTDGVFHHVAHVCAKPCTIAPLFHSLGAAP